MGKEAELQAFLHLLIVMGLITKYDYRKKRERKIEKSRKPYTKKKRRLDSSGKRLDRFCIAT